MKIRLDDGSLFGNDAGEDEDESVLVSYFVDQPAFVDFLDPRVRLQVARGRKGTGKSALLIRFSHDLRAQESGQRPLVLHLVPSSLAALKEPPATDNCVILENYWKQVICGAINMELARDVGFAWKDDQLALVESAELAGFRGRNLVSALLSRLIGKISVSALLEITATTRPAPNHEQLLTRLSAEDNQRRPVWFLLDDIDTKFQNTPAQQAYISSFFSACRYLVRELADVGIRATVRTDVWTSLNAAEDLDKFQQYLTDIGWSSTQQKAILVHRVLAYIKRMEPECDIARFWTSRDNADDLLRLVFVERMKWGSALVPPEHVVRVLGGGRPRWIGQLCRLAGRNASVDQKDRIGVHHVRQAMGEFGRRRLADLYKEHSHQFSDLKRLIESFSGRGRRYTTLELSERIDTRYVAPTGARNIPIVDGVPYHDRLQIAHFLFKCGFINGRRSGNASLELPEFVSYETRPDLLQADTNLDDGMVWELHPAYRNILQTS